MIGIDRQIKGEQIWEQFPHHLPYAIPSKTIRQIFRLINPTRMATIVQRRRLPNELLFEMAKFMLYDQLKRCRVANCRLAVLARPLMAKKHQKLDQLYLDDIRQLAIWLCQWTVRIRKVRAGLYKKAFGLLRELVQNWNRRQGGEMGGVDDRRELGRLASNMDGLYEEVAELGKRMQKVVTHVSTDWLAHFSLEPESRRIFRLHRCRLVELAQSTLCAEICYWGLEDMLKWNEMFQRFGALIRPHFPEEVRQCMEGYNTCAERAVHCGNMLTFCARYML